MLIAQLSDIHIRPAGELYKGVVAALCLSTTTEIALQLR